MSGNPLQMRLDLLREEMPDFTEYLLQPQERFGQIGESLHIAAYTYERAMQGLRWILTDDRWRRVGGGFNDVDAFIESLPLAQFRKLTDERKEIVALVKKLQPKATVRAIAKATGVHHKTVERDLAQDAPEEGLKSKEKHSSIGAQSAKPISGADAAKVVQKAEKKLTAAEEAKQRREASRAATQLPDACEYRIGDARQVLADVPDNSVPLILTDPPYGDAAEPLYRWLGEWSARVLIPGGSLICFTGHSKLDRDIQLLSASLRWWWLLTMPHDQSQRLPGKFVIVNFKPVLWYVKDHRRGRSLMPDVLISPARDKTLHNWSQGEGGVSAVIEHLTDPGELIVDPFAGTGKWGEITANMGRRWLGADLESGGTETIEAA